MSFTFYSSANNLPVGHSNYLIGILIELLIICIIVGFVKKHNIWILSLAIMLGLWFGAGIFLHWHNPDNFISDWINSAAAIGTIGTVFVSLYLSNRPFNFQEALNFSKVVAESKNCKNQHYMMIRNNTTLEIRIKQIKLIFKNNAEDCAIPEGEYLPLFSRCASKIVIKQNDLKLIDKLVFETNIGLYEVMLNGKHKYIF